MLLDNISTFFSEEKINRVSFLREDADFIIKAIEFPGTKLVFVKNNYPFVEPMENETESPKLLRVAVGDDVNVHDTLKKWADLNKAESYELRGFPGVVFLGLWENEEGPKLQYKSYSGVPYFAVDMATRSTVFGGNFSEKEVPTVEISRFLPQKYHVLTNRKQIFKMTNKEASLFSYAAMFLDWLRKYNFCPQCGSPTVKIHAGTKLKCTSGAVGGSESRYGCESKNLSVSNIQFPRTDPVCIIAIVNLEHRKILLGNGLRFPTEKFFSCIAGFMEPGESIEACCSREAWEETGVTCKRVKVITSQPWPFPVNLMIGCVGFVEFNGKDEVVNLGHDPELRHAEWFDFDEVKKLLERMDPTAEVVLPPKTAIAYNLIDSVVNGHVNGAML